MFCVSLFILTINLQYLCTVAEWVFWNLVGWLKNVKFQIIHSIAEVLIRHLGNRCLILGVQLEMS